MVRKRALANTSDDLKPKQGQKCSDNQIFYRSKHDIQRAIDEVFDGDYSTEAFSFEYKKCLPTENAVNLASEKQRGQVFTGCCSNGNLMQIPFLRKCGTNNINNLDEENNDNFPFKALKWLWATARSFLTNLLYSGQHFSASDEKPPLLTILLQNTAIYCSL